MVEAVRVYTRYDLSTDGDEENTRRKLNERVGIDTPKFVIPDGCLYLWNLFIDLNNSVSRVDFNGYYCFLPPSEILAHIKLSGEYLTPAEYEILKAMDSMFCNEMNAEINSKRCREDEKRKREFEAKSSKMRRR